MSIRVNHIRDTTANLEALITPQVAEVGYDVTKKELHVGDGATLGGIRLSKKNISEIVIAAQIVASINDYNPPGMKHAGALHISTDAARDITGLVPTTVTDAADGREITIYNVGGFNATLKDQHAGSAAANRFDLNGADLVLAPKTSATLRYRTQGGFNRWELKAQTAGAAVAAGGVIARTLAASTQGFSLINGTLVESRAGGAMTIAIKTLAGGDPSVADPVLAVFRSQTLAAGAFDVISITAATSLVISSGSSLGATNGAPFRLWIAGFNDAGTFRLGAVNCGLGTSALPLLAADALASSTAEGGAGAADNVGVFYTGVAVATKPLAVLGYLDYPAGLAAAGTWNTAPTTIQMYRAGIKLPGDDAVTASKLALSAFGMRSGMINGKMVENRAGNAATYAIKTLAGNDASAADPVRAVFQDGAGGYVVRDITAALSLTLSSGSTMGFTNGVPGRLWLTLIDTGGAVVLGAVNCLSNTSVMGLLDGVAYSTTAEGGAGAADNAQVIYTAAAQASKYLCIAGYADYDAGLAVAGTWNIAPSRIVLFAAGTPRPGEAVGPCFVVQTGALITGTTQIPFDDTIPQLSEGDQVMSRAYVATAPQNVVDIEAKVFASASGGSRLTAALCNGSYDANNSLAATSDTVGAATDIRQLFIKYSGLAVTGLSTTWSVRLGSNAAVTVSFNGESSVRRLGGVASSFLRISERMG